MVFASTPSLDVVGSEARELVAGIRAGHSSRVLAVVPIHSPNGPRDHGSIWRGDRQLHALRVAHHNPDGKRAVCRRGLRQGLLLPQPAGRRLGQQPDPAVESPGRCRPPELLQHPEGIQRRVGELLLLRRTREKCAMSLRKELGHLNVLFLSNLFT